MQFTGWLRMAQEKKKEFSLLMRQENKFGGKKSGAQKRFLLLIRYYRKVNNLGYCLIKIKSF